MRLRAAANLGVTLFLLGGWAQTSAGATVTLSLVRGDAPPESLAAVEVGSIIPYSHYRGSVVAWATGLNVDGKHFFDARDSRQRAERRSTELQLDLADGEHVVEPLGYTFRVSGDRIESLSPKLIVDGGRLALKLFPVTFTTRDAGQPPPAIRVRIATPRGELFASAPGTYPAPLTVYLPATTDGFRTNVSERLLLVDGQGVRWTAPNDNSTNGPSLPVEGSKVTLPTWRVTGVLLLDQPAKMLAAQLTSQEAATAGFDLEARLGNWDPRARQTSHAELMVSRAGWNFSTGLQNWATTFDEQTRFRHHAFLVDRPLFNSPGDKEKERALQISLETDVVAAGRKLPARWRWLGTKGLPVAENNRLVAFVQQSPTLADDADGWRPLEVAIDSSDADRGAATLAMPDQLTLGRAWLRVGLAEGAVAKPTDRWLAEIPLSVTRAAAASAEQPVAPGGAEGVVAIGGSPEPTRVPDAWRQGVFLDPQNVSAVDISDDGKRIGVATMAFRHDRNFWLLSEAGETLAGRHVDPWAPQQTALLAGGKRCAVGLAYSRFTDPSPTVSIFSADSADETPLVDVFWDMGCLRYGAGDWRTGWPASIVGDLLTRAGGSLFTISGHEGARRFTADGRQESYPLAYQRPFRMAASGDGHVVACGYLAPDTSGLDEKARGRLRTPPALLSARDSLTSAQLWALAAAKENAPLTPKPPEAADDFPELAAEFRAKPLALLPFRVPYSVALDHDGSTVAAIEYGGWLRLKQERGIGSWNPDHPVSYCPRQQGRLRVFGPRGDERLNIEAPAEGLFEVRLDREGQTVWLAPAAWFARGLAGRSWLPADPEANSIYSCDIGERRWRARWQFPDAVSDLAIHPSGQRALVSCWNGNIYLVDRNGVELARHDIADAARLSWSADGRYAVAGTQHGEVVAIDADGKQLWRITLAAAPAPGVDQSLAPVVADLPIYSVGRVGAEHAYVGDIWLIKTDQGAIQVDCGGSSAIPLTWRQMRAAGVDPAQPRSILLSHSHGDHGGAAYLWRAQGARIVAPETAALTLGWLMPTWTDYGVWVPTRIDTPLPLKRVGDEAEITLAGLKIRAIFVPGHSFDSVVYLLELAGKRVAFTGDIGFAGEANILHRCWGDQVAAQNVADALRAKVVPFRPEYIFTGHTLYRDGPAFLDGLLKRTDAALGVK